MDYSSLDEVAKAIMKYDHNLGMTFYNLPTYIYNTFGSGLKESKYSDAKGELLELSLKSALEALLILKRNDRDLLEEKADDLFAEYDAIPEEERDRKADAYEAYRDVKDSLTDMKTETNILQNHIEGYYGVVI